MSLYMRNFTLPTVIENDDDEDYNNNNNNNANTNGGVNLYRYDYDYNFNNNNNKNKKLDFRNNITIPEYDDSSDGDNIQIIDDYDDDYYVDDNDKSFLDKSYFNYDLDVNDMEKFNSKIFNLGIKKNMNRSSAKSNLDFNYNDNNEDAATIITDGDTVESTVTTIKSAGSTVSTTSTTSTSTVSTTATDTTVTTDTSATTTTTNDTTITTDSSDTTTNTVTTVATATTDTTTDVDDNQTDPIKSVQSNVEDNQIEENKVEIVEIKIEKKLKPERKSVEVNVKVKKILSKPPKPEKSEAQPTVQRNLKSARIPFQKRAKSSVTIKREPTIINNVENVDMKSILAKRDEINASRYLSKSQPTPVRSSSMSKLENRTPAQSRLLLSRQQYSSLRVRQSTTSISRESSDLSKTGSATPSAPILNARSNSLVSSASSGMIMNTQSESVNNNNNQNNNQNNGKVPITVDTSKANSNLEVVRLCIKELGWLEMPNGSPTGCDIYWHSSTYHEGYYGSKFTYNHTGRINKFPCMNQLLRKGPLTQALNVMRSIYPDQYDFYPRTWFLPEQFHDFKTDCKYLHEKQARHGKPLTTFIVKPNDGSQGEGIYLIKDPNEFLTMQATSPKNMSRAYIVQEYIDNPYLIDGLKSDLRIYVVLSSLKPLEIHICDEGLVRFATVSYESPDDHNLKQIFMHLTNYSLNKKNESYKFTSEPSNLSTTSTKTTLTSTESCSETNTNVETVPVSAGEVKNETKDETPSQGSKRRLTQIFSQMEKKGLKTRRLRNAIDDLVIKTVFALIPEMKVEYAYEIQPACVNNLGPSCFQIFGFDILLTNELKPMLLEVNCNPSLRIDYEFENATGQISSLPSPIDYDIKKPLVLNTLKLVAPQKKLNLIEKHKFQEEQEEKAAKIRDSLAKERLKERSKVAKLSISERKIDLNKCPLLSKPAKEFIKKPTAISFYSQLTSSSISFNDPLSSATSSTIFSTKNDDIFGSNQSIDQALNDGLVQSSYFDSFEPLNALSTMTDKPTEHKRTKSYLRKLFPLDKTKTQYSYLNILENISDIFVYITITRTTKVMNQTAFRALVRKCYLINEKTTSDNLDILFHDARKKWSRYNRRKDVATGLCFQGFLELFFTLSKINYPEFGLEESLKSMIFHCIYFLKLDGFKENDYCTNSRNGPILMVDERVMIRISQIDELRRNEAKLSRSISSLDINPNAINSLLDNKTLTKTATLLFPPNLSRELSNLKTSQQLKAKKSLFPIYF